MSARRFTRELRDMPAHLRAGGNDDPIVGVHGFHDRARDGLTDAFDGNLVIERHADRASRVEHKINRGLSADQLAASECDEQGRRSCDESVKSHGAPLEKRVLTDGVAPQYTCALYDNCTAGRGDRDSF